MPEPLRVIALISGGKDSLFSLLHCLQHGHKIVALANLHPPAHAGAREQSVSAEPKPSSQEDEEDLNSFMYQTVGHQVIPLYAAALDLPLYRREITGSALQTGRCYDTSRGSDHTGDETEDLLQLLQQVLKNHPDANAVSSGAILSTYQRTRVESVSIRLGLIPLALLWQYPALPPPLERADSLTGLLDDMAAAGCDARIIKIASGGIRETQLLSNITDPRVRSRLVSGMAPFYPGHEFWLRGALLGEGGEYETLAIDGPRPVWKKRIRLDEAATIKTTGEGGVYYLRLGKLLLDEKHTAMNQEHTHTLVRLPTPYDPQFDTVRRQLQHLPEVIPVTKTARSGKQGTKVQKLGSPKVMPATSSQHIILSNVTAYDLELDSVSQMAAIVNRVKATLSSVAPTFTPSNTVFVLLMLSSMSDFSAINQAYTSLFPNGEPNPPARVTVAADLPPGVKASLSVILYNGSGVERRGLHVQSRSYWAPANIGPYSQAICEPVTNIDDMANVHDATALELVHAAGQIPLVPHSMDILEATFSERAILSLQHLWRVGQERGVDMWPWGVAFLATTQDKYLRAHAAWRIWHMTHLTPTSSPEIDATSDGEESHVDVWHTQHNHFARTNETVSRTSVGSHLHQLPNPATFELSEPGVQYIPPFIAAEVVSLPKEAPVEWWSFGIANLVSDSSRRYQSRVINSSKPWGSVNMLVISEHLSQKPTMLQNANSTVLVSVFVGLHSVIDETPSPDSIMDELKSTDGSIPDGLQVLHGSAFVSVQCEVPLLEGIWRSPLYPRTAVIPCRYMLGSTTGARPGEHDLKALKLALLLRMGN